MRWLGQLARVLAAVPVVLAAAAIGRFASGALDPRGTPASTASPASCPVPVSLPEAAAVVVAAAAAEVFLGPPTLPLPEPGVPAREEDDADPLRAWPNEERDRFRDHVVAAAAANRLPERLIEAVIAVESGFDPRARSRRGAGGLMQLMPGTARHLGVRDVFDPQENIHGGARYLRHLLDRYQGNLTLALAAYNAGPGTVQRAGGVPRRRETRDYVRKVRWLLESDPA